MVLILNNDHLFNLRMGGGIGSNTRAKLLGLWGLLHFHSLLGIYDITIYGESNVIIEWIKGN